MFHFYIWLKNTITSKQIPNSKSALFLISCFLFGFQERQKPSWRVVPQGQNGTEANASITLNMYLIQGLGRCMWSALKLLINIDRDGWKFEFGPSPGDYPEEKKKKLSCIHTMATNPCDLRETCRDKAGMEWVQRCRDGGKEICECEHLCVWETRTALSRISILEVTLA